LALTNQIPGHVSATASSQFNHLHHSTSSSSPSRPLFLSTGPTMHVIVLYGHPVCTVPLHLLQHPVRILAPLPGDQRRNQRQALPVVCTQETMIAG
jgi:hypothetical protein